jgi:uncharacterized GH25 family protein
VKRIAASAFLLLALLPLPLLAAKIGIAGRVIGADGKPAANVKMMLIPVTPETEVEALELAGKTDVDPVATTATDAAGLFHLTAPDAGMWAVRLEGAGWVPLEALLTPLIQDVELPDARLIADAGLLAKVTDPQGKPVAHAWIRVEAPRGGSSEPWQPSLWRIAFTDASGTATLPHARDETLTVRAAAAGYLQGTQKSVRGSSVEVRLAAGVKRAIEVRDRQGKGIAGVFVSSSDSAFLEGRTPESGRLELAVPATGVELRLATVDGRRMAYRLRAAKPEETGPAVIVLQPAAPASGRVVAADGRPIAGALAWLSEDIGAVVRSGKDGVFRFPNLPEKETEVFAAATGYFGADARATAGHLPTFALKPRLTASGVVVDETGRPVAGAALKASPLPGAPLRNLALYQSGGFARSSASGRFQLAKIAPGIAYDLRINRDGYAPARLELPARAAGSPAAETRIVLHAGRTAFGKVTAAGGNPVAGAQVSLQTALPASLTARMRMLRDPERYAASPTDATGRFELRDLPAGTFDLLVRAHGYAPLTVPSLAVPEGKGTTDLGMVALAPGAAVLGLVVDPKGEPIAGAEVRAAAAQQEGMPILRPHDNGPADAVTAADGSFRIDDRSPGESVNLTITHPSYGPGSLPGVAVPAAAPVRVVLQPAGRVAGRTVDADGKPVAGATVYLSEQTAVSFGGQTAMVGSGRGHRGVTDDEGGFAFEGVSPGSLRLTAQAPRYQEAELANLELKGGEDLSSLEIVLKAGATIEGRVLSPDGPMPDAEVTVVESSAGDFGYSSLRARTDGDGQYRIDGVPPGKRTLEARAEGYRRAVRDVEVAARTPAVDFQLERGLEASGRVVDDGGAPVAGAQLILIAGRDFRDAQRTLSEADGGFRIAGLQEGSYTLRASKEGYASDPKGLMVNLAGASASGLEVRLSGGGTVSGRVTGLEFSQLSRVRVSAQFLYNGRVDPEGNYQIQHLPPGTYTVTAVVPDTALHAEGRVTLAPGAAEAKLDLQLGNGHTLTGVVLSNGEPLAGAALYLARTGTGANQSAISDHAGGFRFGGLEDGHYDLDVSTPRGAQHRESVDLAGDQTIRVELRTASLAGRVIDSSDGSPVSGADVTLQAGGDRPPSFNSITTDARGAFRVPEVGDGAWKLRATREGYAPAEREVRVDGAAVDDVEIRLDPTQGITIDALLASGQPPDRIRVAAVDAAGRTVSTGTYPTGENGHTRVSEVPPGSWLLLVESDQAAPVTLQAAVPGPALRVLLPPAGQVRIQVPALAEDAATAKVVLTGPGGPYRAIDWDGTVKSEWELGNGGAAFSRVPAGVWQVVARTADGRSWSGTVTVTPGGVAEVALK